MVCFVVLCNCEIVSERIAVPGMTYRADCLLGAGSFSAGTIIGFNAITADYRAFAGVCTIAV